MSFPNAAETQPNLPSLVMHIIANGYFNGEVVRLDADARPGAHDAAH